MPPDSAEPLQIQCLQQSPGSAQGCPKGTWHSRGYVPHTWQGITTHKHGANEIPELISNPSTMCAQGTQVVSKASANYATVTGREIQRLKCVIVFFHLLLASSPASLVSMPLQMEDNHWTHFVLNIMSLRESQTWWNWPRCWGYWSERASAGLEPSRSKINSQGKS